MPTRIVLNDNKKRAPTGSSFLRPPASPMLLTPNPHNINNNNNNNTTTLLDPVRRRPLPATAERDESSRRSVTTTTPTRQRQQLAQHHHPHLASATKHRAILGFRSSLLRELSVRSRDSPEEEVEEEDGVADEQEQQQQPAALRLSSDDIRASPRLLGYLMAVVAGSVQLVSVIQ